ncbi:hypothetical protein ACQPZF_31055 [Actinosynnema sp. CS-041913]|uniref:hypothetical protein n=1 Tax=Actinosynnema sp. CS-041913 TaxID=3239917 RepID=UPI003D918715
MFVVNGFFDLGSCNLLPRITRELPTVLPFISPAATGAVTVFQVEAVLYGLLIVVFLIVEPRGVFRPRPPG